MTAQATAGALREIPQPVAAPLTRAAIFLVVTVNPEADNDGSVRAFSYDIEINVHRHLGNRTDGQVIPDSGL